MMGGGEGYVQKLLYFTGFLFKYGKNGVACEWEGQDVFWVEVEFGCNLKKSSNHSGPSFLR